MRIRSAKLLLVALLALAGGFTGSSIPAKDAAARLVCVVRAEAREQQLAKDVRPSIWSVASASIAKPLPIPAAPLPSDLFQRPPPSFLSAL